MAESGDQVGIRGRIERRQSLALETGDPEAPARRRCLAARPDLRPALLKTITRTARGAVPLRPADL